MSGNIRWIIEKAREFQKNIYFCFMDYAKAFVWITKNCVKFWKRWEYLITWPASWEIYMQLKKQQLELDMEQQTGSKWEKELIRLYIVILFILLICRVHHEKCQAGWSTSWNQDFQEKYQYLRYADDTTLIAESDEN